MKFLFRPEYKSLPSNRESQLHFITTFSIPSSKETASLRPPISIALVIDRSGSMEGTPIQQSINAIVEIINLLTRRDRLSIVTFESKVDTLVPLTSVKDKQFLSDKARSIVTEANTNLSGGWLKGLSEIENSLEKNHLNRVFLLTDGETNQGIVQPEKLIEIGRKFREKGITTSTFGFGMDFNEKLLKEISQNSGGNFYFIEKPEDIANSFKFEFGEVNDIVGQNCEISINLSRDTEFIEDLSSYPFQKKENRITYSINDVMADFENDLVFRLKVKAASPETSQKLFSVTAQFNDVTKDYSEKKVESFFEIPILHPDKNFPPDEEVIDTVILAKVMKAKLLVWEEAQKGNKGEASKIIEDREAIIMERLRASEMADREKLKSELEMLQKIKEDLKLSSEICGKTIQAQIEEFAKKRGAYMQNRHEKRYLLNKSLKPNNRTEQKETMNELRSRLVDLGQETDFMNRCLVCFAELLANAVEHGCSGIPDAKIQVRGVFRRGSAMIQVSDPGNGFLFEEALKKAKDTITFDPRPIDISDRQNLFENPDLSKEHGRGLSILQAFCDEITYTDGGRDVQVRLSNRIQEGVISFDNVSVKAASESGNQTPLSFILKNHFIEKKLVAEIQITGDINMWTLPLAIEVINELINKGQFNVVLNMEKLNYIDSSGLGFFVGTLKKCQNAGGKLALTNLNQYIYGIFKLIQLQHLIPTFDSLEQALNIFKE
ncbi:MAG: anti-sigma factor antagonist [Candidatus Riflebacteria bacterium]|nr:anti-sigma factor antagonist [Candidatus Riflebacteria bacterium]